MPRPPLPLELRSDPILYFEIKHEIIIDQPAKKKQKSGIKCLLAR